MEKIITLYEIFICAVVIPDKAAYCFQILDSHKCVIFEESHQLAIKTTYDESIYISIVYALEAFRQKVLQYRKNKESHLDQIKLNIFIDNAHVYDLLKGKSEIYSHQKFMYCCDDLIGKFFRQHNFIQEIDDKEEEEEKNDTNTEDDNENETTYNDDNNQKEFIIYDIRLLDNSTPGIMQEQKEIATRAFTETNPFMSKYIYPKHFMYELK